MTRAFLALRILLLITTAGRPLYMSYCSYTCAYAGINWNLTLVLPSLFHLNPSLNHIISEGCSGCLCCTCFNICGLLDVLHSRSGCKSLSHVWLYLSSLYTPNTNMGSRPTNPHGFAVSLTISAVISRSYKQRFQFTIFSCVVAS